MPEWMGLPIPCPAAAGAVAAWRAALERGNMRAFRLKIRLKIPGVATHEGGQQELAPNRSGGRAARDDMVPGYTAGVNPALLSTASSVAEAILHHGLGSQRAVRREPPVSPACSPPKRRGDSHPSGKRTWISFTCGFEAPKRHDLVSLAPHPPVCPSSAPFSSASMSGPDIALRLKIARRATTRQDDFHSHPCRAPISRFVPWGSGVGCSCTRLAPACRSIL